MLTPKDFENIAKQAEQLYDGLELEIIQEIATRIANVGYANVVVLNDILIAQEMGLIYQDIINMVADYNETSVSQIEDIFSKAGAKTLRLDDKIYKEAGLNPLPFNQSKSMLQFLMATAMKTHNSLSNLVMTTASSSQTEFYNTMNKAYMEVSTGVKSYSQSIIDSVKNLSKKGATISYPSGYKTSIENAVRMNIITGVNQTCGKLQEMRADEMGWDLMEITAHSGARPEHAEWQGKIVSRSGQKGYLSLDDIGYGEPTGFKGVNCRHDWYPYYKGSSRTYTNEQLNSWKNETVIYNGKKISRYDASQIQRRMERTIRRDKKEIAGLQGILTSNSKDNKLIEDTKTDFAKKSLMYKTHQKELENFLQQTSFVKDYTRLYTGNQDRGISNQISNVTKIANKYNNNVLGMKINNIEIQEIGEHIISRTYARNVSYDNVIDTLKNPIKYGRIRLDDSMQIKGSSCTIVINVKTGKLITVFPKKTKKE